jgi:hypothetical protein
MHDDHGRHFEFCNHESDPAKNSCQGPATQTPRSPALLQSRTSAPPFLRATTSINATFKDTISMTSASEQDGTALPDDDGPVQTPRLWCGDGWTARVIKNDDDEGWAVAMIKDGEPEPALVGPWTMGRDKKNPKPLDGPAFSTLVKTASEVLRRHEQQLEAILHKRVDVTVNGQSFTVALDIVPDEDDPTATLAAIDEAGTRVAQIKVQPNFQLNASSARAWVEQGFPKRA